MLRGHALAFQPFYDAVQMKSVVARAPGCQVRRTSAVSAPCATRCADCSGAFQIISERSIPHHRASKHCQSWKSINTGATQSLGQVPVMHLVGSHLQGLCTPGSRRRMDCGRCHSQGRSPSISTRIRLASLRAHTRTTRLTHSVHAVFWSRALSPPLAVRNRVLLLCTNDRNATTFLLCVKVDRATNMRTSFPVKVSARTHD